MNSRQFEDAILITCFIAIIAATLAFAHVENGAKCAEAWGDNQTRYDLLGGCRVHLAGTWMEVSY